MRSFIQILEEKTKSQKRTGITITMSGPAASGKSTTAKILAERLGLRYMSMGSVFRELAKEEGETLERFLAESTPETHEKADIRQLEHAMRGGVVIEGRLGGWVAGTHANLRFWLTAPRDVRIKRYLGRHKVDEKTARALLTERDGIDITKYKEVYNIDFSDITVYDFVISNEHLNLEETVKVIEQIVRLAIKKI